MLGVYTRILLRIAGGFLLARGLPADMVSILHEPDVAIGVEAALGAAMIAGTEAAYLIGRRLGWRT